jgi:non-homologous end joining protein Ku
MAPRSSWRGYLRLSLVTCPVAMLPATKEMNGNSIPKQPAPLNSGNVVDLMAVLNKSLAGGLARWSGRAGT